MTRRARSKKEVPRKERKEKWRRDLRFEMETQSVQKKKGGALGFKYLYETLKREMREFFFFFCFFFLFFLFFCLGKNGKNLGKKNAFKNEALFWCDDDGGASSLCPLWSPLLRKKRFFDDDDDAVVVRRGVVVVLLQQLAKNDDTKFGPFGRR